MVAHPLTSIEETPLLVQSGGHSSNGSDPIALATHTKHLPSIVHLIQTVQAIQQVYRPVTQDERDLMGSWPGWGPYAPAFESEPSEQWAAVGPQIRELLGPDGYEAASAATTTSYFTAPYIANAIWRIAEELGFSGGTVLEPGCGTGQVLACAPSSLPIQVTGVEQEPFTASIAQLLHPNAHIVNRPLQEVAFADEAFDLVVGNVPFADVPIYDRTLNFKKGKLSLHNYFMYRSLTALRPGGLAILVTSRYTLDAHSSWSRELLSEQGMLLGAIRLPSYGHKWAKTAVITDILVLQKRYASAIWGGFDWVHPADATKDGITFPSNTYIAEHPQQVVGTVSLGHGMYRNEELLIKAPNDLEEAVEEAGRALVVEATRMGSVYVPPIDRTKVDEQLVTLRGDGFQEGCFYLLRDKGLVQIVHGEQKAVTKMVAELSDLVRLRDIALALVEAERDYTHTDDSLRPLRLELNRQYETYVHQYGALQRSTLITRKDKETGEELVIRRLPSSMYAFRTDEHYPLLLGLELYDDETHTAQKAAIFTERVNHPAVYKETAESREEAIALSLDRYGSIDFPFIAKATGLPVDEVEAYLGDLIYQDPEEQTWQIAPQYLSGNVRKKLEIAQKALRADPKWQRNVDALEKVQPEPIPPEDIKVLLGAPWVPVVHIIQFCRDLLKIEPQIVHDRKSGEWEVAPPLGSSYSAEATSTWGTARVNAFKLIEHLLNHKATKVVDVDSDDKPHVNTEETMLAQQKRQEIQTRFTEWIWEDNTRTKELVALYNKLYNGIIPSYYSGEHLSFPGMDAYWQEHLYSWQRDFIARMLTSRSGLCAYPVGAGKTKIQVAGAMTLRRMNLINKAAILVPNHLLEQITSEAKQLYPAANILMISRDDLSRENRRIFMARIATGNYDMVVMTHSAFQAIDVHADTKRAFIREEIKAYKQLLLGVDDDSDDRAEQRRIKRIEKQLARLRERLSELLDTHHDAGLTFEQLGISYLEVDECFPYETPVLTNHGMLPIGRIVEEGLAVSVASTNLTTGELEWKPVSRWIRKQAQSLVKVAHESGEFVCTPNHKIWVEGKGYRQAGELQRGECLRLLPQPVRDQQSTTEILLPALSGQTEPGQSTSEMGNTLLCSLREGVSANTQDATILHDGVFCDVAHVTSTCEGTHASDAETCCTGQYWDQETGCQCSDEGQQSYEQSHSCGENEEVVDWTNVVGATGRQWDSDCPSEAPGRIPRIANGVLYSDETSQTLIRVTPEFLLRRCGVPGYQTRDRGGWQQSQDEAVEIPGSPQNRGLARSRVVRVEVLERGSDERDGAGANGYPCVYNIEVEDNHNYFANGVLVSNCHFFKNLGLPTNQEKLQVNASQRAKDMLMKLRWLDRHNGKRPFGSFFTATPISNSMVEAYVMLWYLDHDLLEEYELFNVDDFASMFIETESKIEVSPNGVGFRMHERPRNFINLPEFQHLFASVADIRSPDILAEKRPARLEHTVSVEPTDEVVKFVNSLVDRSELLRLGRPLMIQGKEDNMLWVTTDGRMAALSMLLHDIEEEYPAKLDAIATEMAKVYHRWQEKADYLPGQYKSFQIGFCDMGTPNKEKGDQVYGQIKRLLVQKGVPASGIRFIHEVSGSDGAKTVLFEQCRTGEVAILLGSTAKLGTGTNIQTRCAAIHHCDAPWRPDEVEQREGRGQRPGNLYPVVEIYYYVQRRTFDAYSWQILSNKAKFFNQLRDSKIESREMAYTDDSSLTYGQVKAAATGDVLLLEHADVSLSADSFARLHTSFRRARDRDRQEAEFLSKDAQRVEDLLKRLQAVEHQAETFEGEHPFMTPNRTVLEKKEDMREAITKAVLHAVSTRATSQRIGYWKGIPLFFKVSLMAQTPYILAFLDPYRGFDVPCPAQWLEKDNHWRYTWRIEQFFQHLATAREEQARLLESKRQKAREFEAGAQAIFPQHEAWKAALDRKQRLDAYIAFAASATTEENLQKLAEMRQALLDSASTQLVERPKPKNMATFVLPPRNPNEGVSSTKDEHTQEQIEVTTTTTQEPTIEQVAREIQLHVANDPWAEPITVESAPVDPWAELRAQYQSKRKRRK